MKHLLALLCCAFALTAFAKDNEPRVDHERGGDRVSFGGSVRVNKPVPGDLVAMGGDVDVTAAVGGNAVLAGGNVRVNAAIGGGLYAAGGDVLIDGTVARNARVAGGAVDFGRKAQVDGNVSVSAGEVRLKGQVKGYVEVAGGEVTIDGSVGGDVEARSGQLTLGPNARIAGKLRYSSKADIRRDPAAQVLGGEERISSSVVSAGTERTAKRVFKAVVWVWSAGLIVLAGVLVALLPGFFGRVAETARTRPAISIADGFITLVCLPFLAVLCFITIVGIPLGLIVVASYLLLMLVGYVTAGIALGEWASTRIAKPWSGQRPWRVLAAMLGVLAITLAARVEWLGSLVIFLALLIGMGSLVVLAKQMRQAKGSIEG